MSASGSIRLDPAADLLVQHGKRHGAIVEHVQWYPQTRMPGINPWP
jgi:hypothetical protein